MMLTKFLKEVIFLVVGKQAEGIVELLDSSKHVNEFVIAKKLDITINQTRNILYKIADQGLVSSIRKKDKKKGWYTYFWKIEVLKSLEFLREILLGRINQIKNQVKSRETKDFYVCERCNIEFSEENALLRDFTCNECGEIFSRKDNSKLLKELGKNLIRFERDLEAVEKEVAIEKEKVDKRRIKEVTKLAKFKADARKSKMAERRKASDKLKKIVKPKKISKGKKIVKKKFTKKPKKIKKKSSKKMKAIPKKKTVKKKVVKKKTIPKKKSSKKKK